MIASGKKVWELRTQPVHLPSKPFYILATAHPHPIAPGYDRARLGVAVAIVESNGYEGPFSAEELTAHERQHRTTEDALRSYAKGRPLYAMRIVRARAIAAKPYRSKPGAITVVTNVEFI